MVPVGTVIAFADDQVPPGWVPCDGRALSKQTYGELFRVIGMNFGGTEDTFKVPDLQGKVIVGMGKGRLQNEINLTERRLGQEFGREAVTLTVDQMPRHAHEINANRSSSDGFGGAEEAGGAESIRTGPEGGNRPHENMQPSFVLQYLIKFTMRSYVANS